MTRSDDFDNRDDVRWRGSGLTGVSLEVGSGLAVYNELCSMLPTWFQVVPSPFCAACLSGFRRTLNLFTSRPSTLPRFGLSIEFWSDGRDVKDGPMVD